MPPDQAGFASAVASQVATWVRDGVPEARLRMNPAEMGPVTVHIAVDGAMARIEFTADVAATRAALEQGLPDLAAALRNDGLTLAGGGVFDQPRGRGSDTAPAAPPTGPGRAGEGAPAGVAEGPAAPAGRRGLIDLYA
jgi:flagellar hook-length control protein FliK